MPTLSSDVVTSEVQQRVSVHDNWIFVAERYLFGCVSLPEFRTADEVAQRVHEVVAVVEAFPASTVPSAVDHSFDDLLALDQPVAQRRGRTRIPPAADTRGSRTAPPVLDTPLAAFADVQSPEEAMARLKTLDESQKLQVFAMFMKVKDDQGRH